jgi:hypothetical protein
MYKLRHFIVFPFCLILLLSCATAPTPPDWAVNGPNGVYPQAEYIAQEGWGKNRKDAEINAMAALSRYFVTLVETSARSTQSISQGGENPSLIESSARIDTNTFVQSTTKLFALRYAAPWYDTTEKLWRTIAYINREEAWAIFEPQVQQTAASFRAAYNVAEAETEPLKQIFKYGAAQRMAKDVYSKLDFATIITPQKTAQFNDVRDNLSLLNIRMDEAKSQAPVFVDCENETIKTIVAAVFSSNGIPVTPEQKQAKYVCAVTITENIQKTEAGTMYTPALTIRINSARETIFSYNARLERLGAQNPDIARRRAYNALANHIAASFAEDLEAKLHN